MRLIDADALIEYFSRWLDDEHYVERTFKDLTKEDIIPIIDKAPTVDTDSIEDSARMRGFEEGYLQGVKDGRNDKRNDK